MRVCDYIVDYLYNYGVKDVFVLAGGGQMYMMDALARHKKMKVICMHNEQALGMAVEAYAKANNHFGVGFVTSGPGATNVITGLAGAYLDSVPCLFISGQANSDDCTFNHPTRQLGVQEINIIPIVKPITKVALFVKEPAFTKLYLHWAMYSAKTERPGPVWLDIPLNVQCADYCRQGSKDSKRG